MVNSGASTGSCPMARSFSAWRLPSGSGLVTSNRIGSAREVGEEVRPGAGEQLLPASMPMLTASAAGPVISTSCQVLPSGVRMRPRKRSRSSSISARPAIGVRQEPSRPARKARSSDRRRRVDIVVERRERARPSDRRCADGRRRSHLARLRGASRSVEASVGDASARPSRLRPAQRKQGGVGVAVVELAQAACRHCRGNR